MKTLALYEKWLGTAYAIFARFRVQQGLSKVLCECIYTEYAI